MKTATTQSDSLALIKEIAERKNKMARIKTQSKKVMRKAPKPARSFMDTPEDTSKNPNYYTDSSKYAQQYYGETYYETTRHDTDWGDY
jgi:hypothetical protein